MTRPRATVAHIALLVSLLAPVAASAAAAQTEPARPAEEDLDQKAKRLFVAGQYAEAIDILSRLYTDTDNPVYLRNIGRCYQRLRDVDRAIASFEEYLLRAKNISKGEREEVQGFVRELEELKRRNPGSSAPAPAPSTAKSPAPAPAPATAPARTTPLPPLSPPPRPTAPPIGANVVPPLSVPPPAATPPAPAASPPAPAQVPLAPPPLTSPLAQAGPPPAAFPASPPMTNLATGSERPLGRILAFGGLAVAGALAVGGGAFFVTSWTKYKSAEKSCRGNYWCADQAAKSVEGRNRASKLLLLGAVVTGAAGVTLLILNPAPETGARGLALGLGGRF